MSVEEWDEKYPTPTPCPYCNTIDAVIPSVNGWYCKTCDHGYEHGAPPKRKLDGLAQAKKWGRSTRPTPEQQLQTDILTGRGYGPERD